MRYHIFSETIDGRYLKEYFTCDANSESDALNQFFNAADTPECDKRLYIASTNSNLANEHDAWLEEQERESNSYFI